MNIKCPYCGNSYPGLNSTCPHCGAPNMDGSSVQPAAPNRKPQTIEELKAFCRQRGMPLEQMRFFIGQNIKSPRAFGIYRDTDGSFVVYKNKTDGSRAVRYRGDDEAYAVSEIYNKLREELQLRRSGAAATRSAGGRRQPEKPRSKKLLYAALAAFVVISFLIPRSKTPSRGYYRYNDDYYYYQRGDWYYYDDSLSDWIVTSTIDDQFRSNYRDYYESSGYDSSYPVDNFYDSGYYYDYDDSSWDYDYDSWDDDSSWDYDYDSWDSYDTDWDSDW